MLDDDKKQEERALAKLAAAILCEEWNLEDSESPDFIVSGPDGGFGLEVTNCFTGNYKKGGSVDAQGERYRQKKLWEIRERCLTRFPEIERWSLEYMGEWQNNDVETHIVSAIESARKACGTDVFRFPIWINKQPRRFPGDAWRYMEDFARPMEVSSQRFQRAIDEKSAKLAAYRQKSPNIRLLVSAFSLKSSGNVSLEKGVSPNMRGFDVVYYMFAPNYVVEFPSGLVKTMTGHTPESLSWRPNPDILGGTDALHSFRIDSSDNG